MQDAKLIRMANDIANNFSALGEDAAIASTANHIRMFWDPRMRARAQVLIKGAGPDGAEAGNGGKFNQIARQAINQLAPTGPAADAANG